MRGFKRPQGVHRLIAKDDFDRALAEFTSGFADDRWEAGRRLLSRRSATRRPSAPASPPGAS